MNGHARERTCRAPPDGATVPHGAAFAWLTAAATHPDKSASARRPNRPTHGHLSPSAPTTSALSHLFCARHLQRRASGDLSYLRVRRAPDDFRRAPHPPFAVYRRATCGVCDSRQNPRTCAGHARLTNRRTDVTAGRRALQREGVVARCHPGHDTNINPSARFGRHTAAGFWRELHTPHKSELSIQSIVSPLRSVR
jgi:hypothetical protein